MPPPEHPRPPGTRSTTWGRRLLIAAVVVLVIIIAYYSARRVIMGPDRFTIEQTRPIVSHVDGMRYRVHEGHAGPDKAADTLAIINGRIIDVMRYLRTRYRGAGGGEAYPARHKAVMRLLARYNPDNLAENSPKDPSGDTAYSLDKGSVIALCLRERNPADSAAPIHDLGVLTFVTLHEMAHIAIDEVDHPPAFWSTFRFLLESAEEAGVYTSPNFARSPQTYCGIKVDFNPRWDPNTSTIY